MCDDCVDGWEREWNPTSGGYDWSRCVCNTRPLGEVRDDDHAATGHVVAPSVGSTPALSTAEVSRA